MKIPANGLHPRRQVPRRRCVFATALLQILRPDIKITRGFVVPDGFDGIVYDIGFGMFDHHQEPREMYRANGVPYAAFGLLWRVLGPGLVGERQARLIDENFIQPLDLNDNTGEQNSLCDAIGFLTRCGTRRKIRIPASSRRWPWQSRSWKTRSPAPMPSTARMRRSSKPIKTPATASWFCPATCRGKTACTGPMPSSCGVPQPARRVECPVRDRPQDQKAPSCPFPQSWAGQPQEIIEQKSGIEGISFCHASRFLITAKDKETALAACRQVLKNNGRI